MSKTFSAMTLWAIACCATCAAQDTSDQRPPRDFATVKARMTARLQEELACVQAATSLDALQACRPRPPEGRGAPPPPQGK